MKIGKLDVGQNFRPKIIAELGINHNGSIDEAKKLAELAAANGADIIKSQLHIPSEEMSPEAKKVIPSHCDKSIFHIMEDCALTIDEEYELKGFIEDLNIEYLCTPFSAEAAKVLGEFKVNAFKVGSGECNNFHVLKTIAAFKKPMIISTGMNTYKSCRNTYSFITEELKSEILLMHTTNLYPTPYELVRLGGLIELQKLAGLDSVGLSDHTVSNLACLGAVALGAVILERHFTDSFEREGPDIINSMDPVQLSSLRKESELMFEMRGGSKEMPIKEEQDTRDFAFATLVALKDIKKGDILTEDNCIPKRPSKGDIYAYEYYEYLGRSALTYIKEGSHLQKEWFA